MTAPMTREELDPADIWDEYCRETPARGRSPQGAMAFAAELYQARLEEVGDQIKARDAQLFEMERRASAAATPPQSMGNKMTDDQIKHMVDRFLNWKLPENFNPDGGVSFVKYGNIGTEHQYKHEPSGTNLLDATQAKVMVHHMIEGMSALCFDKTGQWFPIETAPRDGTRLLGTGGGLEYTVEAISYDKRISAWNTESYTLDDRDDDAHGYNRPSHWMMLPKPPPPVSRPLRGGIENKEEGP